MIPKPKSGMVGSVNDPSNAQNYVEVELTPEQKSKVVTACIVGWLVPGAGHWLTGKYLKGLAFFILLNGLFLGGMALHGEIAIPILNIHSQEFNFVNILVFIFGFGNGIMTIINLLPFAKFGDISLSTYEVGTLFMVVSGSLNVFAVMNVWDLFCDDIESQNQGKKK